VDTIGRGSAAPHKLNGANLSSLAERVTLPTYNRTSLAPSILHIGVGGFHRAHQALYLDKLAQEGVTMGWGERGIGLLAGDKRMAEALGPQDYLYTLVERDAAGDNARIVGSMTSYLFAPDAPEDVLRALADPATKIVSLTITEGGYNVDQHSGVFDAHNKAILDDVARGEKPETVFGYLCAGLERRRRAGVAPFTVLSCDNLPGNGVVARTAVTSFARMSDDTLASWIETNVAFPDGMVDRITPQTTDEDRAFVSREFGVADAWPVMAETFTQWVLADAFCNGRPPLEKVGVQIVSDVHPYETMKLRLLNASHQAMAYLGYLAGYRYADETMSDDDLRTFIARLMDDEVTALLPAVPGIDLASYKRTLVERFSNPKIKDTLARLATDGSDRMPKFLLPSLKEALEEGKPHRLLTFAVAGWFRYLRGVDEQGQTIAIADPLADDLRRRANEGGDDPRPLLALRAVFGDLGGNASFVDALSADLRALDAHGAKAALAAVLTAAPM